MSSEAKSLSTGTVDKSETATIGKFPRVDVRHMAGIYSNCLIRFVSREEDLPEDKRLTVVCANPFVDGRLTNECKALTLEHFAKLSARSGLYMCLLYDEDERIFIQSDGTLSLTYWPTLKPISDKYKKLREEKREVSSGPAVPTKPKIDREQVLARLTRHLEIYRTRGEDALKRALTEEIQELRKPMIETESEGN